MPTADSSASKAVVTAALLVIGGEILSGRTKDLKAASTHFVTEVAPKPFVWTVNAHPVVAAVKRGKQASESIH